jgi:hypothetical protein
MKLVLVLGSSWRGCWWYRLLAASVGSSPFGVPVASVGKGVYMD